MNSMLGQGERTSTNTPDRRLPETKNVHVKSACARKPVGTFVGTHSDTDGETQAKTDIDGKLGRITELR